MTSATCFHTTCKAAPKWLVDDTPACGAHLSMAVSNGKGGAVMPYIDESAWDFLVSASNGGLRCGECATRNNLTGSKDVAFLLSVAPEPEGDDESTVGTCRSHAAVTLAALGPGEHDVTIEVV